jgi:ribonuclease HI
VKTHFITKFTALKNLDDQKLSRVVNQQFPRVVKIYTDASKFQCKVSTGVRIPSHDVEMSSRLPNEHKIFAAEAFALLQALKWIEENNINTNFKKWLLLLDSKSVATALNSYILGRKTQFINWDLKQ